MTRFDSMTDFNAALQGSLSRLVPLLQTQKLILGEMREMSAAAVGLDPVFDMMQPMMDAQLSQAQGVVDMQVTQMLLLAPSMGAE